MAILQMFRRKINHAYWLTNKEREKLERAEHDAYLEESQELAARRGKDKARRDYT